MAAFALFPAMESARRMSESKASGPRADRMFFIFSASASIVEKKHGNRSRKNGKTERARERERKVFAFERAGVEMYLYIGVGFGAKRRRKVTF